MIIETNRISQTLAVLRPDGGALRTSLIDTLSEACSKAHSDGVRAVVVDFSAVTRSSYSGLAALSEIYASYSERLRMAFCGLDAKSRQILARIGMDEILPLHDSLKDALRTPAIRAHRLAGTAAVVLAGEQADEILPGVQTGPKPMLDILGRPVLARVLDHLKGFGIDSAIISTAGSGNLVQSYFRAHRPVGMSMFFHREGRRRLDGSWDDQPMGTATILARLARDNAAFGGDVLVLGGGDLSDIDLARLADYHRDTGADVTIATTRRAAIGTRAVIEADVTGRVMSLPSRTQDPDALVNAGIYLFRAEVLNDLDDQYGLDIEGDLLPALLAAGAHVQAYRVPFNWAALDCGRDYYDIITRGLEGKLPGLAAHGESIRPGVWAGPGATVSPRARIEGPCYIGAGAVVEAGALIKGPVVIGAGAVVETSAVIENSITCPDTRVRAGAKVRGVIAGVEGALMHTFADGRPAYAAPLEGVSHVDDLAPSLAPQIAAVPSSLLKSA